MPRKGEKMQLTKEQRDARVAPLRKYQYKKGQPSANPSGRPARKPLTVALKELLTDNPEVVRELVENAVNKASVRRQGRGCILPRDSRHVGW
jgi:hypothetical protein